MKNTLAVVVFEDNREEAKKAQAIIDAIPEVAVYGMVWNSFSDASLFFGRRLHLGHSFEEGRISDLANFREHCKGYQMGILTDLFMPVSPGETETDAVGVAVAVAAKVAALPVVVCTSPDHPNLHWAESILDMLNIPIERNKDWGKAIELLKNEAV